MAPRTIILISYRQSSQQRAHFAIFVPSSSDPNVGTIVHVVGAPMAGYSLEFKRNYNIATTNQLHTKVEIGQIDSKYIVDSSDTERRIDIQPKDDIEKVATQVPPPRASENFMAPVNDTTNKRCQEWTMEYVRRLVNLAYLDEKAVEIVQSKRDPPGHGIGLRSAGRN